MGDTHTYVVLVEDRVEEASLLGRAPVEIRVLTRGASGTYLAIEADQSGLIGLLRYLHQQGFVLLSLTIKRYSNGGVEDEDQRH